MPVREVELPGVGRKYTVDTTAGGQVVIVLHRTGKREIYRFEKDQSAPAEVMDLTSDEAQQVGAILSQTYFQVAADASAELVMKELTIDWLAVPEGHQLADKSLRDLAIRQQTGASVIAILRGGEALINPDPGEPLRARDTLMVIGNAAQVETFKRVFALPASTTK